MTLGKSSESKLMIYYRGVCEKFLGGGILTIGVLAPELLTKFAEPELFQYKR